MPGARPLIKPLSAGESSGSLTSDEVKQLELQSQRQLEEDIARIFDESIYSDLEVVCGKLKLLTNSCILKARTHKFYHKLESILHVNIGRNTFDEIYSFISDIYTECNITTEEKEIIDYLNQNLISGTYVENSLISKSEEKDEPEVYSTPNCVSPEEKNCQKTLSSSPSTELTKEYYALVPIDSNILDRELIEQDALSNAFQFINKSQSDDIKETQNIQCIKPTSLCLNSSHIPKIKKHSNSCDILSKSHSTGDSINKAIGFDEKKINNSTSQTRSSVCNKTCNLSEATDKVIDSTYTPDSLITDEPSSSSDYLSAAYIVSPGTVFSQLNVGENTIKMDNIVTISDSGLGTSGMLESLNSHKDVTLTDVSLTESTLHDMINDDNNCQNSSLLNEEFGQLLSLVPLDKSHVQIIKRSTSLNSPFSGTSTEKRNDGNCNKSFAEMSSTSTKEEKQKQNEEIVILESFSLSSETGSWESVFPPKMSEKDCEKSVERKNGNEDEINNILRNASNAKLEAHDDLCPNLAPKSPYKSTSCFIDASNLADEEVDMNFIRLTETTPRASLVNENKLKVFETESKQDLSPNDWSGSNDNDDSLEQTAKKGPDSIPEDNLSYNACEAPAITTEQNHLHERVLAANGAFMQFFVENQNATVALKPKDLQATHDPITNRDGAKQCRPSSAWQGTLSVNTENEKDRYQDSHEFSTGAVSTCVRSSSTISNKSFEHDPQDKQESGIAGNRVMKFHSSSVYRNAVSTPNNSIISVNSYDSNIIHSDEFPSDLSSVHNTSDNNSSIFRTLPNGALIREIENIPIVSGAYIPVPEGAPERPPRAPSNSSFWVVDMSAECSVELDHKPVDKSIEELRSASKSTKNGEIKNTSSIDSDSEKSTQKFYIDLSTLPDTSPEQHKDEGNEKKNIFSMFINLGEKSTTAKEMPARFSSSLNTKKITKGESKSGTKVPKTGKPCDSTTSRTTDETIMFEKLESLCADTTISISEIINRPLNLEGSLNIPEVPNIKRKDNDLINNEESVPREPLDLFVKLSDLDKPAPKVESVTNIVLGESHQRMTRSIPDNDWRESALNINSKSIEIISSFHSENALSLNRLFPHLKNTFSRSMPGSLSTRAKSPLRLGVSSSPGDTEEPAAFDVSEMSSVQSSYCRSVVENTTSEEIEQSNRLINSCRSPLGQDLLRMFLEEIAPDVIVEVSGRRIKAHKCILSSRCQYFAGILSGGWVESAGNVISLPPFAFGVVHFALCHIYSGVSVIPDSVNIVELATLADMLCLEGLKEGIMLMLKVKYCHHFHKPCTLCTAGVLECFPLASVYGLDDLYRMCLRWINKYFERVWPTKAFATLPFDLIEKCCQDQIFNITAKNFVEMVHGSANIVSALTTSRWAEVVVRMCRRLMNASAQFAASHFCEVLHSMISAPTPAEVAQSTAVALDDCVAAAIQWASPDQLCRAYQVLFALVKDMRMQRREMPRNTRPPSLLSVRGATWCVMFESALVRNAPRVLATAAFGELPVALRHRLRELGCISYGQPAFSLTPRQHRANVAIAAVAAAVARSVEMAQTRPLFMPHVPKPQPRQCSVDSQAPRNARANNAKAYPPTARASKPRDNRPPSILNKTFPPSVRTTKAQQERAKFNSIKNQSMDRLAVRPARAQYEHTKPRYMEPRKPQMKPKMVSSSESSRNSSPVQRGAGSSVGARAPAQSRHSRDSLASSASAPAPAPRPPTADLSADSLSETQDKYATYTKARHNIQGSVEADTEDKKCQPKSPATTSGARIPPKTTKIPLYTKLSTTVYASRDSQRRPLHDKSMENSLSPVPLRYKTNERKPSGSLMNATKSSQAKMVSKTVKETSTKSSSKQDRPKGNAAHSPGSEIPVMERSGTFLKDEPTFGDKMANIE